MPMRRTIGISLACLVTSACAITKTPEKTASHYSGDAGQADPENSQIPTARLRNFACRAVRHGKLAEDGFAQPGPRHPSFEPALGQCDGGADPCCGAAGVAESSQLGKAAWYDLDGHKTASGEILDALTATAAVVSQFEL